MGTYYHDTCPHCGKNDVQFTAVIYTRSKKTPLPGAATVWNVHMTCNACSGPLAVMVETDGAEPMINGENITFPGQYSRGRIRLRAIYPEPVLLQAPEHVPDGIAKIFIEAQHNLKPGGTGSPETCEMLCRKLLDVATRHLGQSNGTLIQRINALRDSETITAAMADWAHLVRIDTNVSTHTEDETTPENAKELLGFAEMFLLYAFTLPQMVERKRSKKVI